jgi:AraC-like DNA-binding protein
MGVRDTRSATVGGLQTADLLAALGQLGLDRDELCHAAGVDRQALDRPDSRIPAEQFVGILMEAERRRQDPLIGMHAGERCEPRGPVAYLLMSHGSLADGLRAMTRVAALAVDRIRIDLDIGLDTASLLFHPHDPTFESCPHAVEYLLVANLRLIRRAYPDLQLREVDFQHVRVSDAEEAARVLGAPVRFAAANNRIVFPAQELEKPSRLGNPLVTDQLTKLATALAAQVTPVASLEDRVARTARALLADGVRPHRAVMARRLGMSERSLQRGLEAERTTFRAVQESVLWELVEALLSNPALKLDTVARSVGFGDLAAFSKAFRRWTGVHRHDTAHSSLGRVARDIRGRNLRADRQIPRIP